jgi:hypothetical protein
MTRGTEGIVVLPGQELMIQWQQIEKENQQIYDVFRKLKLLPNETDYPHATAFCTYFSREGLSVYISRGYASGINIEAFFPVTEVNWQDYFLPFGRFDQTYIRSRHFTKVFPRDFI